ncbi:MAG: hypothetical protein WBK28_03780 [Minisyncoccia bacterium]
MAWLLLLPILGGLFVGYRMLWRHGFNQASELYLALPEEKRPHYSVHLWILPYVTDRPTDEYRSRIRTGIAHYKGCIIPTYTIADVSNVTEMMR